MAIIDANWHLADHNHRSALSQFQLDQIRHITETEKGGSTGIPLSIVLGLGPVAVLRSDMARIREIFERKYEDLQHQRRKWW